MRNLLRDLSLGGKFISGLAALGFVPGITPLHSIALLIVAVLVKDFGEHFFDDARGRLVSATLKATVPLTEAQTSAPASASASTPLSSVRRSPLLGALVLAAILVSAFGQTGCLSSGVNPSPSPAPASAPTPAQVTASLNNFAYGVANVLQTQNNGSTLQTQAVNDGLALAGVSPKTQAQVAIVNSLTSLVGNAIIAAHNSNASPVVTQSLVNGALAPTAVAATVQQVENPPSSSLWHPQPAAAPPSSLITASF